MLAGEVATLGTSFVISVRLLAAGDGAELLALRDQARDATDLVDAVDRLSARLRERIGESLRTIRADEPLELVTTRSLEALRLYTQSHRVEQSGDWERAVALLEEALTYDSTFAMAYRQMAVWLSNRAREPSCIDAAATRAFELRDRLPAVERYLTEAFYYSTVEFDVDRVRDAYRSVLDLAPEDRTATNNLALLLIWTRRPAEAEDLFRRAIGRGAIWQNYNGLISALAAQSKWEQAESTLVEFDRWSPSHPDMLRNGVYLASTQRDYERADSLAAEFLAVGGGAVGPLLQVELSEIRGRLEDAERVAARELADALREGDGLNVLQWAVWPIRHHVRYRDDPEAAVRELEPVLQRYPLDMAAPSDRPPALLVANPRFVNAHSTVIYIPSIFRCPDEVSNRTVFHDVGGGPFGSRDCPDDLRYLRPR